MKINYYQMELEARYAEIEEFIMQNKDKLTKEELISGLENIFNKPFNNQ